MKVDLKQCKSRLNKTVCLPFTLYCILRYSAKYGRVDVVKALLNAGADCSLFPASECSVLQLAQTTSSASPDFWVFDQDYHIDLDAQTPTPSDFKAILNQL